MRRLAAGDEEALRVLYTRFGRPVFALALRMLGSPQSAEELTQDLFVTVWRKSAGYDPTRGRLSTWLMTIAHNLCVDRLRREARRPVTVVEDLEGFLRDEGDTSEHEAVADRDVARRILAGLSRGERRLLLLAYYRGWTAREIAEAESIPLGTVKTRMRAALIKLRRGRIRKEEA